MKRKVVSRIFSLRTGLGVGLVGILTWCLAGSLGDPFRTWAENQVAPYTVFAPFSFTVQDSDRVVEMERGELIVSKGQRLTGPQVGRLDALERLQHAQRSRLQCLGAFLLALLLTVVGSIYLKRYEPKIWKIPQPLLLVGVTVALTLGFARLIAASPLAHGLIPVAVAPMLLGLFLTPRVGILLGFLVTGLVGMMAEADLPLWVGWSIGCFVGAYTVHRMRRRIHFFRAGLITGLIQAGTVLAGYWLLAWPFFAGLSQSLAALGGGIAAGILTFCLAPLCESLFGCLSDVSLVELSDLNHPLLKELSVKAPGTYHHSLIVAALAEAASEAVGANALLARVGCYFHDIGKMNQPEYFVENQSPQNSRHDRLSPSLSSLVILNHVKDGVELARKNRLNPAIIDFIPGHHGTGLIYYFYRRALEEVEDEALLKEERFRYPGPKPKTRETAIALLADSVEAATRASSSKNPARIQEVVRRIINNKFIDGQMDECDLTLADLNRIAETFARELMGIYHHRIEYPKPPGEEAPP